MAFLERDDRRIYYASYGTGKPIVFLHGITNSGRAWGRQIGPFLRAGFRVIIPDLAGHGSSSPILAPMNPKALAQDVLALLDELKVERANCCGLSLGGMVAIEAAAAQPDKFDRLVIANSFVRSDGKDIKEMADQWKSVFRQPDGPTTRLENLWPVLVSQEYRNSDEALTTYQTWHAQAALADGESYCHIVDGMLEYNATELLPELAMRTLLISSENDQISPVQNSTDLAHLLPASQHVTIDGSEHISNVDSADMFNEIVVDFLAS